MAIEKVLEYMNDIAETVNNNNIFSEQQLESFRKIETEVGLITNVVQTNSASAEETSATSEELSAQAIYLTDMIQSFKTK